MFQRILVPSDGSKCSLKAEDVAISIAEKFNSTLLVVHVIDEKLINPFEVLEEEGNKILDDAVIKAREKGIEVEPVLIVGNPVHDMVKITEKTRADLLVMGTHGKSRISKIFMGSVAENAIKNVKIPVLLIK